MPDNPVVTRGQDGFHIRDSPRLACYLVEGRMTVTVFVW